jgi:hypothetical protein
MGAPGAARCLFGLACLGADCKALCGMKSAKPTSTTARRPPEAAARPLKVAQDLAFRIVVFRMAHVSVGIQAGLSRARAGARLWGVPELQCAQSASYSSGNEVPAFARSQPKPQSAPRRYSAYSWRLASSAHSPIRHLSSTDHSVGISRCEPQHSRKMSPPVLVHRVQYSG